VKSVFSDVLAMTAMQILIQRRREEPEEKAPKPIRHEWDNVSLSKSERRGKTYEEIQELRKAKYESRRND